MTEFEKYPNIKFVVIESKIDEGILHSDEVTINRARSSINRKWRCALLANASFFVKFRKHCFHFPKFLDK